MYPTDGYSFTTSITELIELAGQAQRYDEIGAALANKKKVPLEKFQEFVFDNLDRFAAFYKGELEKIGRPLTADEFKDIIKRGVDEFEKELSSA